MSELSRRITIKEYGWLSAVAEDYARSFWEHFGGDGARDLLLFSGDASRFNIALAAGLNDLNFLTQRGVLISESLLITTGYSRKYSKTFMRIADAPRGIQRNSPLTKNPRSSDGGYYTPESVMMDCPDPEFIGRWLLDTRHLHEHGLASYLPSFVVEGPGMSRGVGTRVLPRPARAQEPHDEGLKTLAERISRHRVATWRGEKDALLNDLVRPVLRVELPFLDNVSLPDFARITVNELASYRAFRDFLRGKFLDLDAASGADQMDRALAKVGLEIADGIRSVESELAMIKSRRAVAVTGAAISTVTATLVAVSGPALAAAVAILGTSGGIWGMINAAAEGRQLRAIQAASPWYFVWTLQNHPTAADLGERITRQTL